MPSGGKREGAGQKLGNTWGSTKEKRAAQLHIQEFVAEHLDDILFSLLERAKGVEVVKQTKDGEKYYSEPPNAEAIKVLLEHAFGKPNAKVEHVGEDGGEIVIRWLNDQDA